MEDDKLQTTQSLTETLDQAAITFIDNYVARKTNEIEKNGISRKDWQTLGEFGLLGINAPKVYGGLQQSYQLQATIIEHISRYSPS